MRPATWSICGGQPRAVRASASSAASIPPMDQPTSTSAVPAESVASRSARRSIIAASARAPTCGSVDAPASAASKLGASPGHATSARAPLPGISTPITSIHSGAARASSEKAAIEPPAYARQ